MFKQLAMINEFLNRSVENFGTYRISSYLNVISNLAKCLF